jgi:hypothetical protein
VDHSHATFGVIAGGVYTLCWIAFQKWRELPLIESRVVQFINAGKVTEVAVTVTVFNRSPATMLRFDYLQITKPKGICFAHREERGPVYYCNKDIAPSVPGSAQFPSASARAVIIEWPPGDASVVIRISIRSRSAWMIFSLVSIKLPKTV